MKPEAGQWNFIRTCQSLPINSENYNCNEYVCKESIAKRAAAAATIMLLVLSLLPCTALPQPHCLWMLNSGMNYPGLDPRSVLLKGISRPINTSLSYKKSLAGFKISASITLCGFVVCNVSYTEIFQVITQAERCWEWKKGHGPISKTHSKIHCPFHRNELDLVINGHYRFACTHKFTWAHILVTTRNTENICIFKGEKASALQYCYTLIL